MIAANTNIGIYFISIWEKVFAINIKGMGTCMHRNQRKEYRFVFVLAYPKGRLSKMVKANKAKIM